MIGPQNGGGGRLQLDPVLNAAEKPGGSQNARCGEKWRQVSMQVCGVAPSGMNLQCKSDRDKCACQRSSDPWKACIGRVMVYRKPQSVG